MAFNAKQIAFARLRPDIAVLSECAKDIDAPAGCSAWVGAVSFKGLAVVSYGDYRVSLHRSFDPEIRWAAPVIVTGPQSFFVLAIWSQRPYATGVEAAINMYRNLISTHTSVVAGDFNQNAIWDRPKRIANHSRNVKLLDELGLASAYHHYFKVAQGSETQTTHFGVVRRLMSPSSTSTTASCQRLGSSGFNQFVSARIHDGWQVDSVIMSLWSWTCHRHKCSWA